METIKVALDSYAMDHDIMPASLSSLPKSYLRDAYAKVLERDKEAWKTKLAYFVVGFKERGLAYAETIPGILSATLKCPANERASTHVSYGLNSDIAGPHTTAEYRKLADTIWVAADSKARRFSGADDSNTLAYRHKRVSLTQTTYRALGVQKEKGKKPGLIRDTNIKPPDEGGGEDQSDSNDPNVVADPTHPISGIPAKM